MSHTTTIPCSIRNVSALKIASEKLGLSLHMGQTQFKSYEKSFPCAHALSYPGARFEIGVIQKATAHEEYELKFDSFDSVLAQVAGYELEHLIQGYQAQLVIQEMPFGWDYTQTRQSNGDMIMELSH